MLIYDIIKHWCNARLGQSWVCKSNNGLKASIKYTLLLLNIAKLLILNFNSFLALSNSQEVAIEMSR